MGFARATDERGLAFHWRISTVAERTPDEHAMMLTQLLDLEGLDLRTAVSAIAISSSAPSVTTQLRRMANRWFSDLDLTVIGPGTKSGMPILYDNPREVGADRIADAVGAYDLYPGASIVVDLGTATVFDVISAKGEYLGGAIAPGVAISLEALYAHAVGAALGRTRAPALGDRSFDRRIDPVGRPLRLRGPGRRGRRAHPRRARRGDGHRHRGPRRSHRAAHQARRSTSSRG